MNLCDESKHRIENLHIGNTIGTINEPNFSHEMRYKDYIQPRKVNDYYKMKWVTQDQFNGDQATRFENEVKRAVLANMLPGEELDLHIDLSCRDDDSCDQVIILPIHKDKDSNGDKCMEFELKYVEDTVKSIYYKLNDVTVIMGDTLDQLKDDVEHCRNFIKLDIDKGKFVDPDGVVHKYCYMDPNLLTKSAYIDGYEVEVFDTNTATWIPVNKPDWDETKLYRAIILN